MATYFSESVSIILDRKSGKFQNTKENATLIAVYRYTLCTLFGVGFCLLGVGLTRASCQINDATPHFLFYRPLRGWVAQYQTTMHEKVKQFLEEAQQRALEERKTNLIKWGFVEMVECPKGEHDDYYYDRDLKRAVYYQKIVVDVSDADYQVIAEIMAKRDKEKRNNQYIPLDNTTPEDILNITNTITLVFSILIGLIILYLAFQPWTPSLPLIVGAIAVVEIGVLAYCVVKVWLKQAKNIMEIKQTIREILVDRD